MFEAYKIGVRISLINDVSAGLGIISRHLVGTGKDVDSLQARLNTLKKFTIAGAAMSAGGIFGLGVIDKMIKPAEGYIHQLNIMNMAGMKQADIAAAVGDAWKLAGQNMTTTATGNLKALLDLRNVTGSLTEAREFLPLMQRMQTVLAASKEGKVSGHSDDLAFSAMKALDIKGAVNDPEHLKRQADMMTKVIIGTQGRVTPDQFQSVFNYARQAKFALSDDFSYKILPTLMLENASKGGGGGGSKGVGPKLAAMYRLTNQGYVSRKSLPLLKELGLLGDGKILPTTTPGTVVAPLRDAELARNNSFEWTNQTVVPRVLAYLKHHHMKTSDQNVLQVLNMVGRGNQLAGDLMGEFYFKKKNFERDAKFMEDTMSPEEAYKSAMTRDPATARRALSAAWENFETSLTLNVVPVLIPALFKLSSGLNTLGEWARRHPNVTKDLMIGLGGLSAALAVGGPLLTGVALTRFALGGLPTLLTSTAGGLGGVITAIKLLGGAAGVLVAAYAGWKLGGLINDNVINPTVEKLTGDKGQTLGGWIYDKTHVMNNDGKMPYGSLAPWRLMPGGSGWDPMFNPTKPTVNTVNTVMPAAQKPAATINNTIVMPDGRVLAQVVTKEQAKDLQRPHSSSSGFDPHRMMLPVGVGIK